MGEEKRKGKGFLVLLVSWGSTEEVIHREEFDEAYEKAKDLVDEYQFTDDDNFTLEIFDLNDETATNLLPEERVIQWVDEVCALYYDDDKDTDDEEDETKGLKEVIIPEEVGHSDVSMKDVDLKGIDGVEDVGVLPQVETRVAVREEDDVKEVRVADEEDSREPT